MDTTTAPQLSTKNEQAARAIALAAQRVRNDRFGFWLKRHFHTWSWDWNYLRLIRRELDRITYGPGGQQLMLFLPPRHGKSEMVTIRYPVFRLHLDPELRVIVGAYNQLLANKFSRRSRRFSSMTGISLSRERTAVEDWETSQGGGIRAVGVGGGITGQGGDLIIIDDPVKSAEEAASQAYREKTFEWYSQDLYTRREPGASIILIMTRWHADDLAGKILASDDGPNWSVINLPAIAEEDDPLGRPIGAALNPLRYPVDELLSIKNVQGPSAFNSLYQGSPLRDGGNMFKLHWFEIVDEVPKEAKRIRYWDKAATPDGGDYTVGVLMARSSEGIYYVEDVVRGQWETADRDRIMKQTAQIDAELYSGVGIKWEEEPGSSGKDVSRYLYRLLDGYRIIKPDRVTGPKEVRAAPFAAQCEAGNVKLKRAIWNAVYLEEHALFNKGKNDDQVDGSSGGYNYLSSNRGTGGIY